MQSNQKTIVDYRDRARRFDSKTLTWKISRLLRWQKTHKTVNFNISICHSGLKSEKINQVEAEVACRVKNFFFYKICWFYPYIFALFFPFVAHCDLATHTIYSTAQRYGLTCNHYSAKFWNIVSMFYYETLEDRRKKRIGEEKIHSQNSNPSLPVRPPRFSPTIFFNCDWRKSNHCLL